MGSGASARSLSSGLGVIPDLLLFFLSIFLSRQSLSSLTRVSYVSHGTWTAGGTSSTPGQDAGMLGVPSFAAAISSPS